MTEGIIEEIVARCLLDPSFARAVRREPAKALKTYKLDEAERRQVESADFEKILRFSGFICKIQHNHLWDSFPVTRQLLCRYGVELEVFTAYRPHQLSSSPGSLSRDDRTRAFLNFLERHLADQGKAGRRFPALAEVLRHERSIWEVWASAATAGGETGASINADGLRWGAFRKLVPHVNGRLLIGAYDIDPLEVVKRVRGGSLDARPTRRGRRKILAYWADKKGSTPRVFDLDGLSAHALSRVNGVRSVGSVVEAVRRAGLAEIRPSAFRAFFEQAAESGLIRLRPREGKSCA